MSDGQTTATAKQATVLVVDDEPVARRGLRRLLEGRDDVTVVGECDDGAKAVVAINRRHPDIVLLDVQMPGLDGFGVLAQLDPATAPVVIFVTAYDEFAIAAFQVAAVDYVVKPFTDERLMQAIDRALARRNESAAANSLRCLVDGVSRELNRLSALPGPATAPPGQGEYRERFLISIGTRDTVLPVDEVVWIRANGYYASLVGRERKEYLVRLPLDQLERDLDPGKFLRVHRSAIVRISEVRGIERSERHGAAAIMRDGTRIPISRSRRDRVARALGSTTP